MRFSLSVEGMHCGACVRRLKKAVDALGGVSAVEVNIGRVEGDAVDDATLVAVNAAIQKAGFELSGKQA